MMKRWMLLALICTMALPLAACGDRQQPQEPKQDPENGDLLKVTSGRAARISMR